MKTQSQGEMTLLSIAQSVGAVLEIIGNRRVVYRGYDQWLEKQYLDDVYRDRRSLYSLRRRGLIESSSDFSKVRLTGRGAHEVALLKITSIKKKMKKGICYVIFDIPESRRRARRSLTRLLKAGQFIRIQKSIWKTDRDISRELALFIRLHNAQKFIRVIVGEER